MGRDSKPCFPGHPTQGLVSPPRGNYQVRGPFSPSGGSRCRKKNAQGVLVNVCAKGAETVHPDLPTHHSTPPPRSSAMNWTGPGPVAHTGQGPGMSWDPARVDGMGVGCRASAPLQLHAGGLSLATEIPPWPRYSGDRLPDLQGGLELQRQSLSPGQCQAGPKKCPKWACIRGLISEKAGLDQSLGHEGGRGKSKDLVGEA